MAHLRWADMVDDVYNDFITINIKRIETYETKELEITTSATISTIKTYMRRIWGDANQTQRR